MDDSLKLLTAKQIQTILKKHNLPFDFKRKSELVKRLSDFIEGTKMAGENENGESGSGSTEVTNSNGQEDRSVYNTLPLREVEESMVTFDGESGQDVDKWIAVFEASATAFKWSDIQKYVYLRKLLRGAAKLAVEASPEINNWETLKELLQDEFAAQLSSMDIHRKLSSRKKQSQETYLEYIFTMKKVANNLIDEKSLVSYIIAGIPDSSSNKMVLYDAKNIRELRGKLDVYKEFIEAKRLENKIDFQKTKNFNFVKPKVNIGGTRCLNCGAIGHITQSCPNKSKGTRCFKCNNFGHIAKNCLDLVPTTSKDVGHVAVTSMQVSVEMFGISIIGLIDTGSDVNLIRKSILGKLNNFRKLDISNITLTGLGKKITHTYGCLSLPIKIDRESFDLYCYVVDDFVMNHDLIIGKDLLSTVEVNIINGEVTLRKVKKSHDIPENDINVVDASVFTIENEMECIADIQNPSIKQRITTLINNYTPKKTAKSCVQLEITLKDEAPVYQNPRRLPQVEKDEVNKQINQWLEEGIIRHSNSEYASPIVLVRKKDGSKRICIDYRKINSKIIKDRYPLPLIEDIIENLYDAKIFSTLDLKNGFFHVDVKNSSQKYTAFVTPDGHYEFLKVPFGLCNAPSVFQRYINTIFQPLIRDKIMLLYMDDIMVPANSEAENLKKLEIIFKNAEDNGLEINFGKSKFVRSSIDFLGHIISNGSIKPSVEKTKSIRNFPEPKTCKQVQSFLGLAGYFRKFIGNFSAIAKPLSDLTRKHTKFEFHTCQKQAFETLKLRLCDEPILKMYNPKLETELHSDASKEGYGGVLLQKHPDDRKFHPVYYVSFKTTEAEAKRCSYELEVLAIIKCLEKLRVYLLGLKFKIYTDCKAFQLTMKKKDLCAKIARWAMYLEEYDCEVLHRSGSAMRHVDALSRSPSIFIIEEGILQKIRNAQSQDKECQLIAEILKEREYNGYLLRNGIVFKFVNGSHVVTVPRIMQHEILKNIHENGHISRRKVEAAAKQDYDIPKLSKRINETISNCVHCILATKKYGKQEGYLNPIEKFDVPLHTYHVDHLGPLPSTAKNYKYLFVVVDGFAKFTWIYTVKTTSTEEVLKKLDQQQAIFGNPKRIISDRGTAFTSHNFEEYCTQQKIQHVKITTGVPRGNGQVERINGIIIPILTKLSLAEPLKWYKQITTLQKQINSTVSRSTNNTPFKLMFGVDMFRSENYDLTKIIEEELINEFSDKRVELRENARQQIKNLQDENRKSFNQKRKMATQYNIGDLVAISRSQFGTGLKIRAKYLGPYEVTALGGNDRYDVRKVGDGEGPIKTLASADLMKPWVSYDSGGTESSGTEDFEGWPSVG